MPSINTTFPGGGSQTATSVDPVSGGGDMDFFRLMAMRSMPQKPTGPMRTRGTGPRLREGLGVDATDQGAAQEASFATNMWGPNQVGGYIPSAQGGRAVFAGNVAPGASRGGGVSVAQGMRPHQPQFGGEPEEDPAIRIQRLNAGLGPSLAQNQLRERLT